MKGKMCPLPFEVGGPDFARKPPSGTTVGREAPAVHLSLRADSVRTPETSSLDLSPLICRKGQSTYFTLWPGDQTPRETLEESGYFCLINLQGVLGTNWQTLFSSLLTQVSRLLRQIWAPTGPCAQLCQIFFLRWKYPLKVLLGNLSAGGC